MKFGFTKRLHRLLILKNSLDYSIRKRVFGVGNANTLFQMIDKWSVIPILKKNGAMIGENCDIETPISFHNCRDFSNLSVGNNCHIGKNCFFDLRERISIGDNAVISMRTTIITHQDLSRSSLCQFYPPRSGSVVIEKDSYVGANSTILMGVTLGEMCLIAAGSVVLRNVAPRTLVGGIPARELKKIS